MDKEELLTCAFCGQSYPPGTPPTQHAALTAHIEGCRAHPMFQWKQRAIVAEAKLHQIRRDITSIAAQVGDLPGPSGEGRVG